MISFLQAHIAQLTQSISQLALPPSLQAGAVFLILIILIIIWFFHRRLGIELRDTITLVILGVAVLTIVALGVTFFSTIISASSGNTNLAGKFWGMSINLTLGQETVPVYYNPSWWQVVLAIVTLIIAIPALFSAVTDLRKVERSLAKLEVSISHVNQFGINVTPKGAEKPLYHTEKTLKLTFRQLKDWKKRHAHTWTKFNTQLLSSRTSMLQWIKFNIQLLAHHSSSRTDMLQSQEN